MERAEIEKIIASKPADGQYTFSSHRDAVEVAEYALHLEAQWDELNNMRVDESNRAYVAEQKLDRLTKRLEGIADGAGDSSQRCLAEELLEIAK